MLKLYWDQNVYREESAALRGLAGYDDALVVGIDVTAPAQAAVDVLQARRAGTPIVAYCAAPDPLEGMLARVCGQIASSPDPNQRRTHLAAVRDGTLTVGGVALGASAPPARDTAIAAGFICRMADAVAAFTSAETTRWSGLSGKPIRQTVYASAAPIDASPRHGGITVYAPSTPRAMLAFVDLALALRGRSATYITAENAAQLPQTEIVVAPEWWRPARALALAAAGFRVVCPARSGAAARAQVFDYAEFSADALDAALDAAASGASPCGALWEPAPPSPRTAAFGADAPLVSIVVRTYDRPALLARALESIRRQTYPNVELVVVNNGGPDVREIVSAASGGRPSRYVVHPERATIGAASNLGARAAGGSYVGYLDDDDLLYPDHVALAVEALLRSEADLAYTNCVGEYAVVEGGRKSVLGIGIYLDREFNLDALYASNFAPIHSIVHRRDLFERFGYFDESLPVTDDWDLWLRAAHGGRFVHVDRPTCEYSWRIDSSGGNMTIRHQQDFVDCYKRITAAWSARVADRQEIRQAQAHMLAMQEQRVASLSADPSRALELLLAPLLQNAVRVHGLLDETPGDQRARA